MSIEVLQPAGNMLRDAEPATEEKLEELERLLQSQTLQGSESLKAFLRFVVLTVISDEAAQLKEYTIATEVFSRSDSFDARTDSVVRVQARRLRSKLEQYYTGEGKDDKVLIELPKGHYNPVFTYLRGAEPATSTQEAEQKTVEAASDARIAPAGSARRWKTALALSLVLMSAAVAYLGFSNLELRRQAQQSAHAADPADFGAVWDPFFISSVPPLLIVSNPPVYRFSNGVDPEVLLKKSIGLSPDQAELLAQELKGKFVMKQDSIPRLILSPDDYTGMGEAIGLYRITDLFRSTGRSLMLKQSRTVSAEDMKNHNVILLGSVWANEWSGKLPIKEDFSFSGRATIENNNPQPGEAREYTPRFNARSGELMEDYTLITVKPGISDKNTLMILSGIHSEGTQAAAEYVTSKEYLGALNERLRQMGNNGEPPRYYQVLLKVDVDNSIPTTVSILAIHHMEASRN